MKRFRSTGPTVPVSELTHLDHYQRTPFYQPGFLADCKRYRKQFCEWGSHKWVDVGTDSRGWTETRCSQCNKFYGFRPPASSRPSRRPLKMGAI